jgi:hypothetical protein
MPRRIGSIGKCKERVTGVSPTRTRATRVPTRGAPTKPTPFPQHVGAVLALKEASHWPPRFGRTQQIEPNKLHTVTNSPPTRVPTRGTPTESNQFPQHVGAVLVAAPVWPDRYRCPTPTLAINPVAFTISICCRPFDLTPGNQSEK